MNRVTRALVAVLLLLFAASCRVDTTVDIRVEEDGAGEVTVTVVADATAVALLVDDPADLVFTDLEAAGWDVDGPVVDDGGITLAVTKAFLSADELGPVLGEILGDGLLLTDVSLTQAHDFAPIGLRPATTSYDFTATVDAAPDLTRLGDDEFPPRRRRVRD